MTFHLHLNFNWGKGDAKSCRLHGKLAITKSGYKNQTTTHSENHIPKSLHNKIYICIHTYIQMGMGRVLEQQKNNVNLNTSFPVTGLQRY